MALIECHGCGHRISSKARYCPKCGCTNHNELPGINPGQQETHLKNRTAVEPAVSRQKHLEKQAPQEKTTPLPQPEKHSPEPQQPDKHEDGDDWYFISPAGRNGPVKYEFLLSLFETGKISNDTKIWRAGLPDWIKYAQINEMETSDTLTEELPKTDDRQYSTVYLWTLALAPIWGTIVQIIATEAWIKITHEPLDYYSQMWWIVVTSNLAVSFLDYFNLNKHGDNRIKPWFALLPPAYIYQRDRDAHAGMLRLWIWIGSILFSIITLATMNSIYSRISGK